MTDGEIVWETLDTFEDELSAQAVAGQLRIEGIPVEIRVKSPLPGLVNDVKLFVPGSLAHRARRIINSAQVSDEELILAATGKSDAKD